MAVRTPNYPRCIQNYPPCILWFNSRDQNFTLAWLNKACREKKQIGREKKRRKKEGSRKRILFFWRHLLFWKSWIHVAQEERSQEERFPDQDRRTRAALQCIHADAEKEFNFSFGHMYQNSRMHGKSITWSEVQAETRQSTTLHRKQNES